MTKITLNPVHEKCVVAGFKEFVEDIDLEKYMMQPNDGRVIIKQFKDKPGDNKSEGGIVLTDVKEEEQHVGVVVAVGRGIINANTGHHVPSYFKPGDVVFFPEHFGHNFYFGDDREKLLTMLEQDVIDKL
ncbi:hypothetical protein SIPHO067v1_p0070 [Vibrio phage 51E28.1]|nr:hypothetical protein SIPHO067v1_p0070 [Vibrio phage 51E28.1]